ncbi:MAG: hypothetical protein A07HN63_01727 [uncultured archaeon A07HN63]|nr:MAG: hypothetical protein A07HN63_01727 [uncultured archaeon A07HN63]
MSNHPIQNGTPGQRPGDTLSDASVGQQLDEDALRAFVGAADTGTLDDCEPGTVSAAVRAVRALLEVTDRTAGDETATQPAERKWAEAAGSDPPADETVTTTPSTMATGAVNHELLPPHIGLVDARRAYGAVLAYLAESGPATKREIVTDVMSEAPLGYALPVADEPVGDWWYRVIQPALSTDAAVSYRMEAGYVVGDWLP